MQRNCGYDTFAPQCQNLCGNHSFVAQSQKINGLPFSAFKKFWKHFLVFLKGQFWKFWRPLTKKKKEYWKLLFPKSQKLFLWQLSDNSYGILEMEVSVCYLAKTTCKISRMFFCSKVVFCKYFDWWNFNLTPPIFLNIIKPT